MGKCCKKNNDATKQSVETESTAKKLVNNLKSSIFCGTKGFLTFNLAFLSYLEYGICDYALQKQGESNNQYTELKKGAAFAMKRNTIPFFEMITILPLVCLASTSLLQCALICIALMIATCFIVRTFNLREKLLKKMTSDESYDEKQIEQEFKKDAIKFPIFDKNRKHIEYNLPNQGQLLNETGSTSFLTVLLFPLKILLKVLQSCIMISLAAVELLEAVPSFCVDVFGESFASTKSNFQRSGHLLYASVRNIVPISILDKPVAELIGTPKGTCCVA